VVEHTIGLMLALNRKLQRAYNRLRERNFALAGLLGFDMRCCSVEEGSQRMDDRDIVAATRTPRR
jgi:hypothetical protein